jgi:hypothetical protein
VFRSVVFPAPVPAPDAPISATTEVVLAFKLNRDNAV